MRGSRGVVVFGKSVVVIDGAECEAQKECLITLRAIGGCVRGLMSRCVCVRQKSAAMM